VRQITYGTENSTSSHLSSWFLVNSREETLDSFLLQEKSLLHDVDYHKQDILLGLLSRNTFAQCPYIPASAQKASLALFNEQFFVREIVPVGMIRSCEIGVVEYSTPDDVVMDWR
jgi:hypothetical protein